MKSQTISNSTIPSLIILQAQNFIPSIGSSILGTIIPGVSVMYVGGSVIILKPDIDFVMHGTPPVLAPAFLLWFTSASFYLRLLIIVDLPTFGTPPIIIHDPTVLN